MPIIGRPQQQGPDDPPDDPTPAQPAGTQPPDDPMAVPPEVEFPRVNTDRFEAPERNTDRRRTMALLQLAGAAGSLFGAAGDSSMLTSIGAGLSAAGDRGVDRVDEQFRQKQKAYQDFLQRSREFNRQAKLAESQSEARRTRQLLQNRQDRQEARRDRQLERELDQPSDLERRMQEQELDKLEAQTATEREQAETQRARQEDLRREETSTTPSSSFDDLPDNTQDLRSLRSQLEAQADALRQEMPTGMRGFGPNREPTQPVLRRQLSERIATKRAQIAAVEAKLAEREAAGQGQQQRQQGQPRGDGQAGTAPPIPEGQVTTQPSVFNQGGAAAPGGGQGRGQGQRQRQGGQGQGGQQRQLSERQIQGIVQQAPDSTTASREEIVGAARAVLSEETPFSPRDFEDAYGFNPFTRDSVQTQR